MPMPTEVERSKSRFQIYEIDLPMAHYQYTVVAHNLARAIELFMVPTDDIRDGQMLMVRNVTNSWICHSRVAAESTFSLLGEKREGFVDFDSREGWSRVDGVRL